ncbi:rhodanese-like domain-containing protein [Magnetococcus sp. PR-3]|uniref:rhodanese-like domain-containing protein n=1 Tax=Magnetococcus sp. PR-3 TaxID=3120355 RepID=UPI002FCDF21A
MLKKLTALIAGMGMAMMSMNAMAEGEGGGPAPDTGLEVNITRSIGSVEVKHGAGMVKVLRNQDQAAVIDAGFAKTSRKCPPFCAMPMDVADGVRTIGEVEVIEFMTSYVADGTGLLVDARTPDWHAKGTIPGSINIPYTDVSPQLGADEVAIEEALAEFGVEDGNFANAKYLVLWCNGPWCGQSPTAIRGLLEVGYPKEKLIYYRGGMQMWKMFGLTVVAPADE